jgi:hypothetical protein
MIAASLDDIPIRSIWDCYLFCGLWLQGEGVKLHVGSNAPTRLLQPTSSLDYILARSLCNIAEA